MDIQEIREFKAKFEYVTETMEWWKENTKFPTEVFEPYKFSLFIDDVTKSINQLNEFAIKVLEDEESRRALEHDD